MAAEPNTISREPEDWRVAFDIASDMQNPLADLQRLVSPFVLLTHDPELENVVVDPLFLIRGVLRDVTSSIAKKTLRPRFRAKPLSAPSTNTGRATAGSAVWRHKRLI